jgi:hypothetical protein
VITPQKDNAVLRRPRVSRNIVHKKQDRQCTYNINIEARLPNYCCRVKTISIAYSERVFVALVIQRVKRLHHSVFLSVVCPCLPYFLTLSHKRHDFRGGKMIESKMCVLIFCTTYSETYIFVSRIKRDVVINVHRP